MNIKPRGLKNKKCLDLRGEKFGLLSPYEIDETRTNRVYWLCRCACGKVKSVASKHLVKGLITSCGCKHYKIGRENPCWRGYEDISKKCWETYRRNARLRGLKFSISQRYVWKVFTNQDRKCALTGIPLSFKSKDDTADGNASLDRIDSSKGYVMGNVWWVDKNVNTIKWNLPLDIFLKTCKLVVEHNKV